MAVINHAKREINAKIVYYGNEGVGKGTSLRYLHTRIKPELRGELKSRPAGGGSLLFFDFAPFEQPMRGGYRLRLHLYTLHGRVANPAAWKMTLKGADGLVLVMDAAADAASNRQVTELLREYLSCYGLLLDEIPAVVQLNKTDLPGAAPPAAAEVPGAPELPVCPSSALNGSGVLEALSTLSRQVFERLEQTYDPLQGQPGPADSGDTDETPSGETSSLDGGPLRDPLPIPAGGAGEPATSPDGTMIVVPLAISLDGRTRRLKVAISVEPDDEAP
jgi:signal recognition particle receptor subunit beta